MAQVLFLPVFTGNPDACAPRIYTRRRRSSSSLEKQRKEQQEEAKGEFLAAHFFAHFSFDAHSPFRGYRGRRRVGCGRRAALFWLRTFGLLPLRMRREKKGSDRAHHAVQHREGLLPLCLHLALRRDLPSPPSLVVVLQWAYNVLTSFKAFELLFQTLFTPTIVWKLWELQNLRRSIRVHRSSVHSILFPRRASASSSSSCDVRAKATATTTEKEEERLHSTLRKRERKKQTKNRGERGRKELRRRKTQRNMVW